MSRALIASLAILLCISFSDAGVSYVRWGRSTCPAGNILLYTGYMAGPHYNAGGNGANFLCMHKSPKFVNPIAGSQSPSGYIVGVEAEIFQPPFTGLFKADNIPSGNIAQNDLLCAVCHVGDSTDELLVPGRPDCGDTGYELQYKGFLVSEIHGGSRGRSQFVCLDEAPEGRVGGTADDNQGVIYPVQIGCGSLPCNPYVADYEVPCAICTY